MTDQVGTADTFEPKLPTLYQRFRTAYPHVSLLIRGYSHSSLLSALERGEVDAILNYMPMPSGQESPSILLHKNHLWTTPWPLGAAYGWKR